MASNESRMTVVTGPLIWTASAVIAAATIVFSVGVFVGRNENTLAIQTLGAQQDLAIAAVEAHITLHENQPWHTDVGDRLSALELAVARIEASVSRIENGR